MLIPRFSFLQYRFKHQAHLQTHPHIELIIKVTFDHQLNQFSARPPGQNQTLSPHSLTQPTVQVKTLTPHEMPSLQSFLLKRPDALSRNERLTLTRFLRKQSLVDSLCQQAKALKFKTTDLIVSAPSR